MFKGLFTKMFANLVWGFCGIIAGIMIGNIWFSGKTLAFHTPTSYLEVAEAQLIAQSITDLMGGSYYQVANTGSMRPWIDTNSIIITEPVIFDDLKKGNLIVYEKDGDIIAHQLLKKRGDEWTAVGYNNIGVDRTTVTERNIVERVVAIIYLKKD